jgi:hypothetical protein
MGILDALSEVMRNVRARAHVRPRRIGRREAQRLLTGEPVGRDRRAVAELLSAAAGPPRRPELRDEAAAVASFMRASRGHARPSRRSMRPVNIPRWTSGLAIKVATAAAAVTLTGTAFAAENGALPQSAQQVFHDLFAGAGVPAPPSASPRAADHGPVPTKPAATASPPPATDPSGDQRKVLDLCRQYQAWRQGNSDEPLDQDDLQRLAVLAGGAANMDQYCAKVVVGHTGEQSPEPSQTPSPSRTPSATATPSGVGDTDSPAEDSSR